MNAPASQPAPKVEQLKEQLTRTQPLLVAYSGGVDSTVLLALALEVLGDQTRAVIADSPSLPRAAFRQALELAERMGAQVDVLKTAEMENPDYSTNPVNRCFFCKAELFQQMEAHAARSHYHYLAYGENADDMRQVRPGRRAAEQYSVLAPLRDAGLTKADIRFLAKERDLPNWDAPSQPCLSSRIPHGIPVTADALRRVEQAEEYLRSLGFRIFRVRHISSPDQAPSANLLFAPDELAAAREKAESILGGIKATGFEMVTIDPEGYRGAIM